MRLVCEECGKRYEYDADDFCPRCGAYNRPPRTDGGGAGRATIRRDGVNEDNHRGSFVHREVHSEKWRRAVSGLDQPKPPRPAQDQPKARQAAPRPARERRTEEKKKSGSGLVAVIVWIIVIVQFLRVFFRF